jgi:hypothetical protein
MANAIDAGIWLTAPYDKSLHGRQMRQYDCSNARFCPPFEKGRSVCQAALLCACTNRVAIKSAGSNDPPQPSPLQAGQSHVAKKSENPNENREYIPGSIPLRSRSDSVASFLSASYAIALPLQGREE